MPLHRFTLSLLGFFLALAPTHASFAQKPVLPLTAGWYKLSTLRLLQRLSHSDKDCEFVSYAQLYSEVRLATVVISPSNDRAGGIVWTEAGQIYVNPTSWGRLSPPEQRQWMIRAAVELEGGFSVNYEDCVAAHAKDLIDPPAPVPLALAAESAAMAAISETRDGEAFYEDITCADLTYSQANYFCLVPISYSRQFRELGIRKDELEPFRQSWLAALEAQLGTRESVLIARNTKAPKADERVDEWVRNAIKLVTQSNQNLLK